jgi:hypothetical protein
MTTLALTPAQHAILAYAIEHTSGKIEWFPDQIKGGARTKVLEGLSKRHLINQDGTAHTVSPEGYDALGRARPAPAPLDADPEIEAVVAAAEATWAQERAEAKPRTREHSKQATVIQMLRRPEGATVKQLCEATGWQAHTVRGTFAGAFKKKLGLNLVSDKAQGGDRVYRIA